MKLQPVDDPRQLDSPEKLRKFYSDFIDNYFRARELGLKSGIDVYCINCLFTDAISGRFCEGSIAWSRMAASRPATGFRGPVTLISADFAMAASARAARPHLMKRPSAV